MNYVHKMMGSPLGTLTLVGGKDGLAAVLWEHDDPLRVRLDAGDRNDSHPVLVEAERQLTEYFEEKRTAFSIGLDLQGTSFQKSVWRALLDIPFGETRSYGSVATAIGEPRAVRAVGAANGRNPVSIIVPCHRVVGATGRLTGFAGGLEAKAYLLRLEGSRAEELAF